MDIIFQKSKRINPEILLAETEVIKSTPTAYNDTPALQVIDVQNRSENKSSGPVEDEKKKQLKRRQEIWRGTRTDVLEGMIEDKQKFYENYIKIQNSKIAEQKRRKDLLEEKNKLLKEYLQNK